MAKKNRAKQHCRRPDYWRVYFKRRKGELKKLTALIAALVAEEEETGRGLPAALLHEPLTGERKKKRGRPRRYDRKQLFCLCVLKSYWDWSFLMIADLAPVLFQISPDDNTIWRLFEQLDPAWLTGFVERLAQRYKQLAGTCWTVCACDSTELTTSRYKTVIRAMKETRKKRTRKLHCLTELGSNIILSCLSSTGEANDSPFLRQLLPRVPYGGLLLADRAYFSRVNITFAFNQGFFPLIRPKAPPYNGGKRSKVLQEAEERFERLKLLYRQRGLVEAPFGNLELRLGSKLRTIKQENQDREILLCCLVHNLLAYLQLEEQHQLFFVICIISILAKKKTRKKKIYGTTSFFTKRISNNKY